MSLTSEELTKIAITYINSDCTIGYLADTLNISKSTLTRYFSGKGKVKLSPELQVELDRAKHDKWLAGKSTNGNLGHKKYSDEEIVAAATKMVEDGLTLRDLASSANDPSIGTLYGRFDRETLGEELYQKVTGQYEQNIAFRSMPKEKDSLTDNSSTSELANMVNEAGDGQKSETSHFKK